MGVIIVHCEAVIAEEAVIRIHIVEDHFIGGVVHNGLLHQVGAGAAQGDHCVCDRNVPGSRGRDVAAQGNFGAPLSKTEAHGADSHDTRCQGGENFGSFFHTMYLQRN